MKHSDQYNREDITCDVLAMFYMNVTDFLELPNNSIIFEVLVLGLVEEISKFFNCI